MKKPMKKAKRYSGEDGESEVIDLRSNKESPTGIDEGVRERAKRFLETGKKDEEASTPAPKAKIEAKPIPKPTPKAEPKPAPKVEAKSTVSKSDKEDPEMVKKAYAEAAKMNAPKATEAKLKADKENPAAAAKATREAIAGPDKNLPAPEPESWHRKLRRAVGIKSYKSGGSVKSSASSRGDGIATKGRTRGRIC